MYNGPVILGEVSAERKIVEKAISNVIAKAILKSEFGEEWHNNWIVIDNDEQGMPYYRAFEPDNTEIYSGINMDDACKALNESTFGD